MLRLNGSIIVRREVHQLFLRWKDVESFPRFMRYISSVTYENGVSHWEMEPVPGMKIRWDARIKQIEEDRKISWESISGDIGNKGEVLFTPEDKQKTRIELTMVFETGFLGESMFRLLEDPRKQLQEDLENFRREAES